MRWEYTDRAVWLLTALMVAGLPVSTLVWSVVSWWDVGVPQILVTLGDPTIERPNPFTEEGVGYYARLVPPWPWQLDAWQTYLVELHTDLVPGLWYGVLSGLVLLVGLRLLERMGRHPVQHTPLFRTTPPKVTPVQAALVMRGHPHPGDVVGVPLLQLGQAGLVSLEHTPGTNEWVVTPVSTDPEQWALLPEEIRVVTRRLRLAPGGPPRVFDYPSPEVERRFRGAYRRGTELLSVWATDQGLMWNRSGVTQFMRGFMALGAGVLLFPLLMQSPVGHALFLAGIGAVGFTLPNADYVRSTRGAAVAAEVTGYWEFLMSPQGAAGLAGSDGQRAFEEYLPFAVALGRVQEWVERYEEVTGLPPQVPTWLPAIGDKPAACDIADATAAVLNAAGWFAREYIRVVAGEPRRRGSRTVGRNRW